MQINLKKDAIGFIVLMIINDIMYKIFSFL